MARSDSRLAISALAVAAGLAVLLRSWRRAKRSAGSGRRDGDRLRPGAARQALPVGRHRPGRVRLLGPGDDGLPVSRGRHRADHPGAVGHRAARRPRPQPGDLVFFAGADGTLTAPGPCRPGHRPRPDDRGVRDRLPGPASPIRPGAGRLHPAVGRCPVSIRAPLIAGTVLSLAVISAWSWLASLAIGPAAPLHLTRNLAADYAQLAAAPTGNGGGAVRRRRVDLRGVPAGLRLAAASAGAVGDGPQVPLFPRPRRRRPAAAPWLAGARPGRPRLVTDASPSGGACPGQRRRTPTGMARSAAPARRLCGAPRAGRRQRRSRPPRSPRPNPAAGSTPHSRTADGTADRGLLADQPQSTARCPRSPRTANARAAVQISRDGTDWTPWTTYQTGAYAGPC